MAFVGLILRDAQVNWTRCDMLRGSHRTLVTCRFACPRVRVSSLKTSPGDSRTVKVSLLSAGLAVCIRCLGLCAMAGGWCHGRVAVYVTRSFAFTYQLPPNHVLGKKNVLSPCFPFLFHCSLYLNTRKVSLQRVRSVSVWWLISIAINTRCDSIRLIYLIGQALIN